MSLNSSALSASEKALGDALRLSLFIFKIFILLAFVFYLGAGVFTVPEGRAGIVLINGRLAHDHAGNVKIYKAGTFFTVPPPIGKVIIIPKQEVRHVETSAFLPALGAVDLLRSLRRRSREKLLRPGKDGYILCGDGSILHVKLRATYCVKDPALYFQSFGLDKKKEEKILLCIFEEAIVRNGFSLRPLETNERYSGLAEFSDQIRLQLVREFSMRGLELRNVSLIEAPKPEQVVDAFLKGQKAVTERLAKVQNALAERLDLLGPEKEGGQRDDSMSKAKARQQEIISKAETDAMKIVEKARRDAVRVKGLDLLMRKNPQLKQSLVFGVFRKVLNSVDVHPLLLHTEKREFRLKLQNSSSMQKKEGK